MICIAKLRVFQLVAIAALLLSTGCVVGPKFNKPAPPAGAGYTPAPVSTTTSTPDIPGGEAQSLVDGADISGQWWTLFHSKELDALIERSLKVKPGS